MMRAVVLVATVFMLAIFIPSDYASALTYLPQELYAGNVSDTITGNISALVESDNIAVTVTDGMIQGSPATTYLRPSADISTDWNALGCAGAEWDCVNDAITMEGAAAHDTVTYINTAGLTGGDYIDTFSLTDMPNSVLYTKVIDSIYLGIVWKQNETTGTGGALVRIDLISATNGTACDTIYYTITNTAFAYAWLSVDPICTMSDWVLTPTLLNDTEIKLTWQSPWYHTATITALTLRVVSYEAVYGMNVFTRWVPRPSVATIDLGLFVTCSFTGGDGTNFLYITVLFNGLPLSYSFAETTAEVCDGNDNTLTIPQPSGGGYGPTPGYMLLNLAFSTSDSQAILTIDRWRLGIDTPTLPTNEGFGWLFVIMLVASVCIILAYKFGDWYYGD